MLLLTMIITLDYSYFVLVQSNIIRCHKHDSAERHQEEKSERFLEQFSVWSLRFCCIYLVLVCISFELVRQQSIPKTHLPQPYTHFFCGTSSSEPHKHTVPILARVDFLSLEPDQSSCPAVQFRVIPYSTAEGPKISIHHTSYFALSQGMERGTSSRGCSNNILTQVSVPSSQFPSQLVMSSSRRQSQQGRITRRGKATKTYVRTCARMYHIVTHIHRTRCNHQAM